MAPTTLLDALKETQETRWRYKDNCEAYTQHVLEALRLTDRKDIPLADITQGWIELVRARVRLNERRASTANRKLASLRSVLNLAGVRKALPSFPVPAKKGARPFTEEELGKVDVWFRANCGSNIVKAYYAVLRDTGARGYEELSRVTTEDINWDGRELALRSKKGSRGDISERIVWLTDVSERALSWLVLQELDPLFTQAHFNYFTKTFRMMREELFDGDPHVLPYSLRHSFAMRLHRKGVSIHAIAKVMGHASIQTTLSYLHTTDEDKTDILAALET